MKKQDFKLSEEAAENQFDLFLDFYDIDIPSIGHKDLKAGLETSKLKIIRAIRKGRLEITENDTGVIVVQHITDREGNGDTITYGVVAGKHKVAMKDKADTDNYGKIYALMGSLSGLGETAIQKLQGVDSGIVECLGGFYLQV
jgi:hypothetical protein